MRPLAGFTFIRENAQNGSAIGILHDNKIFINAAHIFFILGIMKYGHNNRFSDK